MALNGIRAGLVAVALAVAFSGFQLEVAASAQPNLGNRDAAMEWLERLKDKLRTDGPQVAADALKADDSAFSDADVALAISRLEDGQIYLQAHSMYPLVDDLNITEQVDSEGRQFAANLLAAARNGGGMTTVTNRLGKDGELVNLSCYAEWAPGYEEQYLIMSCYNQAG